MKSSEGFSAMGRVELERRCPPPGPEGATNSESATMGKGPEMPDVRRSRSRSRSRSREELEEEEGGLMLPLRSRPWVGGV